MQRLGHGHTSFFAGEHPFNPLQDPTDIGSPPLRSSGLTVHLVQGKYWTRCQPLPTKGVHSPGLPDHPPCMSMRAQGLLIPKSPVEGRASLLHLQLSTCSLRRLKLANAPRPPSLSLLLVIPPHCWALRWTVHPGPSMFSPLHLHPLCCQLSHWSSTGGIRDLLIPNSDQLLIFPNNSKSSTQTMVMNTKAGFCAWPASVWHSGSVLRTLILCGRCQVIAQGHL